MPWKKEPTVWKNYHKISIYLKNILEIIHQIIRDTTLEIIFPVKHIWGHVCQRPVSRAGSSNSIPQYLWGVISCPCPWYLLLGHKSFLWSRTSPTPTPSPHPRPHPTPTPTPFMSMIHHNSIIQHLKHVPNWNHFVYFFAQQSELVSQLTFHNGSDVFVPAREEGISV